MRKLFKSVLVLAVVLTSSVLAGADDIFCTGVTDKTYVRDPSVCYRFFLCADGQAHLQYCPEGQYFDFFLQGCDDKDRVYCADGGGTVFPTPETTSASDVDHSMCDGVPNYRYLPSFEACNRYYQCMNGQAFPFLCPVGQFFDEPRQTCDLEDNVECNPATETTTSPTAPTPDPTVTPPPGICVGVPNFQYVRYPNSCYRYVQCINDIAYSFVCAPGLWFNEITSECDDPANVDCDPFIPTPPPTTTTPTPPSDACDGVPDGQFIRSPFTCHTYFRCENNSVAQTYNCPIGEWFDEGRQECDTLENVECDIGGTTTTTTSSPGEDICEDVPDGQFIRSPDDCHIFFECNGGQAEEMECPIGEWFDEERQECDLIENVDCDASEVTTPYPTPPSTEDICQGMDDYVYVPSPTSCSLFYMCLSEIPYVISCPPGQWFDFELQGCDLPENVECNIVTTTSQTTTPVMADENDRCIGVEDYTYIPSFESCNDYYMCRNDTAYLQSCPPGMYFDMERQTCDLPQNVVCDITTTQSTFPTDTPPTPPSPAPTTTTMSPPSDICEEVPDGQFVRSPSSCYTYYVCEGEEIEDTLYCPIGEWFDQELQECEIIDNVDCDINGPPGGDICEDVPDGQFVRSPDACHIFYECDGGNAEEMMCPIGEWFDVDRQECDIIDNVDCELGGAITTTTSTTSIPTTTVTPTPEICEGVPDGQYVQSPNACQLFYFCLDGVGDLRSCPIGEWFDEERQDCDLIENVDCKLDTVSTTPASGDENARCIGVEDYTYIPSFESCNDYIMCRNDTAYPQSCPPGMYFDMERQTCDLPQNVVCDITTTQSTFPTDTPPTPPSPAPTTTTMSPPVDICEDVPDGQFVGSPFSCYAYYMCEDEAIEDTLYCPIGEWFDVDRQECDIMDSVDCELGGGTTTTTSTPTVTPTPEICEGIPDGQYVRSPNGCQLFYVCLAGVGDLRSCPIGEWFDEERQQCDLIENVDCDLDNVSNRCIGVEDYTYIPSFESCNEYYMCRNDTAYPQSCPPGMYFDMERQTCDLPQNVVCDITTTQSTFPTDTPPTPPSPAPTTTTMPPPVYICEDVPDGQFVRSPFSCYAYYMCEGEEIEATLYCPIGEWFDVDRQECDAIDTVDCELDGSATTTTSTTPGGDICESTPDGDLIRHPDICYLFYECNNGEAGEEQSCPIGKWFDQDRQECDEIDNVECDV